MVQDNRGHAESSFWTSLEVTEYTDFALRIVDSACIDRVRCCFREMQLGVVGKKKFVILRDSLRVLRIWSSWQFNGVGRMDVKKNSPWIWLLPCQSRTRKDNSEDHGPLGRLTVTRRYHLKSLPFERCFEDDNQDYMPFVSSKERQQLWCVDENNTSCLRQAGACTPSCQTRSFNVFIVVWFPLEIKPTLWENFAVLLCQWHLGSTQTLHSRLKSSRLHWRAILTDERVSEVLK